MAGPDYDEIVNSLLLNQQGQVSSDLLGALVGGLSRTTLENFLQPDLGVATGVIDPEVLFVQEQNAYDYSVAEAQNELLKAKLDLAARLMPEAVPFDARYDTVRTKGMYQGLPEATSRVVATAWQAVAQGADPEVVTKGLEQNPDSYTALRGVMGDAFYNNFVNDLNTFASEEASRRKALARFEESQIAKEGEVKQLLDALEQTYMAPDRAEHRRDFFKGAGVPALAYLPDPAERYEISGPEARLLSGRQFSDPTASPATSALRDYSKREAEAAKEGRMLEGTVGRVGITEAGTVDPRTDIRRKYLESQLIGEQVGTRALQKAMGRKLEKAGRTPYQDAMSQLLRAGIAESK